MCGIAGVILPAEENAAVRGDLEKMLALIAHRGPDGAGLHSESGVAIGMRRLSIIDLTGGAQPIWNEDETVAVVFNGEIYNYQELSRELAARGHQLRTHSDTEVLVHLYEEAGAAMVERLRGMFAFAILDRKQRRLFLARDHFGQKPLYYTAPPGGFAFASELKSLLALGWVDSEPDPDAFLDYSAWLSLPPPRTHFRHIHKLPAGSSLEISLDGPGTVAPRIYWRYQLAATPDLTNIEEAADALDTALHDSVKLHLHADVPVGVLLSSGLDSRVVSAHAQDLQEGRMQTFTVGFGAADSELRGAAETAREINSLHHELELSPFDLGADISRIARHLDEPIGDPACFAVFRVCQLARAHVKVLLSGEGSDELFAGYEDRYRGALATLGRSERWRPLSTLIPRGDPARVSRWQRFANRAHHSLASEIAALQIVGLPGDVRVPRGLTPEQLRDLDGRTRTIGPGLFRPQRDLLSALLAFDLDWQLAESLLQKADKMSMAASIELRTPILDREVAAVAGRIPSELKLPKRGPGKFALRNSLARRLREPMNRPKKGFPVPLAEWFRGPLRAQVEGETFAPSAAWRAHLDPALIEQAWKDQLAGAWDGARFFYSLWLHTVWARELPK